MAYIGKQPAVAALTASDITDGIISEAKMANDAISLAELKAGTDGNVISYDSSGNPVAIATGTAGHFLKSAGAGAQPTFAVAEPNLPYIRVKCASQSISATTATVLQFNSEVQDSESSFNSSTYRWIPQIAGKYFIGINCVISGMNDAAYGEITIQKNGANHGLCQWSNGRSNTTSGVYVGSILDLNGSSDYVDGSVYSENAETMNGNSHIIGFRISTS